MLSLRTSYAFLLLFCRIFEEGSRRDLKTVFKGRARGRGLRSFFKSGGGPRIFPIDEPLSSAFGRLFRAGRHSAFCRPFCHTLLERLSALPHQAHSSGVRVAGRGSRVAGHYSQQGQQEKAGLACDHGMHLLVSLSLKVSLVGCPCTPLVSSWSVTCSAVQSQRGCCACNSADMCCGTMCCSSIARCRCYV